MNIRCASLPRALGPCVLALLAVLLCVSYPATQVQGQQAGLTYRTEYDNDLYFHPVGGICMKPTTRPHYEYNVVDRGRVSLDSNYLKYRVAYALHDVIGGPWQTKTKYVTYSLHDVQVSGCEYGEDSIDHRRVRGYVRPRTSPYPHSISSSYIISLLENRDPKQFVEELRRYNSDSLSTLVRYLIIDGQKGTYKWVGNGAGVSSFSQGEGRQIDRRDKEWSKQYSSENTVITKQSTPAWRASWKVSIDPLNIGRTIFPIQAFVKDIASGNDPLDPIGFGYSSESMEMRFLDSSVESITRNIMRMSECGTVPRLVRFFDSVNQEVVSVFRVRLEEALGSTALLPLYLSRIFGQTRLVGPFVFTHEEFSAYHSSEVYPNVNDRTRVYIKYLIEYDTVRLYECPNYIHSLGNPNPYYPDLTPFPIYRFGSISSKQALKQAALREQKNYILIKHTGWSRKEWKLVKKGIRSPTYLKLGQKLKPEDLTFICKSSRNPREEYNKSESGPTLTNTCASAIRALSPELPFLMILAPNELKYFNHLKSIDFKVV